MVSTRAQDRGQMMQASVEQLSSSGREQPQRRQRQANSSSTSSSRKIPTAAEQEQQLQADRAKIEEYRKQWQGSKGVHAVWRHVLDMLWWAEHICGVNMLDYEEKVVVVCIFLAVLVLVALGAYKQSASLLHLMMQKLSLAAAQ